MQQSSNILSVAHARPVPLPPCAHVAGLEGGFVPERRIACLEATLKRRTLEMTAAGHDLKQPLQTISSVIERLSPHCRSEADIFWLAAARGEAERLSSGLTRLALAAQDTQPARRSDFSLAAIFDELEAAWAAAAMAKGLTLRIVHNSGLINSDRAMLFTILTNLIGNAVKHVPAGGILVGARRMGDAIAIDVIDNGPGFGADLRERMFRPFVQDASASGGLGLGLWLVEQSVRALGHALEVASSPDKGARFRVVVPLSRP